MIPIALFSGAVFLFFMPFNSWGVSLDLSRRIHEIEVVAEFPHDPDAFTQVFVIPFSDLISFSTKCLKFLLYRLQGLLYAGDDTLYESTGLYKQV